MKSLSIVVLIPAALLAIALHCNHATEPPSPPVPDTTSHAIVWQKELFGVAASSYLDDVAIINDTLAYAVGLVWLEDTPGHLDPLGYNFLLWNGKSWKAIHAASGAELRAVYAFAENDIWVAGGGPYHWDGQSWKGYSITGWWTPGYAARFWGTSSSDLYMVGENGCIAHFDGRTWTKIESGTTMKINDIYGAKYALTASWEILAVAANQYESHERRILRIAGVSAITLSDVPLTGALTSCWFPAGGPYYVAGAGILRKNQLSDSLWMNKQLEITPYFVEIIRGTAANDVFAAGDFGELLHYSGTSWKSYRAEIMAPSFLFHGMAIRGNLIILVGEEGNNAAVLIGKRMP